MPAPPAQLQRSYYLPWIQSDLSYWREQGGIAQDLVDEAPSRLRCCFIRFQIVGGKLYVAHGPAGPDGLLFPAGNGRGWNSAKGRVPYAILALMDVLRHFPGEIPDVDAVFGSGDFPRVRKDPNLPAPPLFSFNSNEDYADIPFPDYSYWGHEMRILNDDQGRWVWGWDNQREFLTRKWGTTPLSQRRPQVVWRGQSEGQRYALRKRFMQCPSALNRTGEAGSAGLFNVLKRQGNVNLRSNCAFRYQAYLEGKAWSTNLKQKLACGSVVVVPKMEYYEFWSRALRPGRHYLEMEAGQAMCRDAAAKIKAMNDHLDGPDAADVQRLLQGEQGERDAEQPYAWGSHLTPQQIADEATQFLHDHLRMEDVRLYLLDVLIEYAALQRFQPRPLQESICYTGKRLLAFFGSPFEADAQLVARQFPWLESWDPGCSDGNREHNVAPAASLEQQ